MRRSFFIPTPEAIIRKQQTLEPRYYPISSLDIEARDVIIVVNSREVIGKARFTNSGKQRLEIKVGAMRYEDVPKTAQVSLWRPINESAWAEPLPATATLTRDLPPPPKPTTPVEEVVAEGPFWPHTHYVRLGKPGEWPETLDELEARLSRALRTQRVLEREVSYTNSAWPKPLQIEAQVREKMLVSSKGAAGEYLKFRREDYDDFHIDKSELNARPAPWSPEPRDVSDYESGRLPRAWMDLCPKRDRRIIAARSLKPPLAWWRIADEERMTEDEVQRRYWNALKTILKRVAK